MFGDKRVFGFMYPSMMGRGCVASVGEKAKTMFGCTKVIVISDTVLEKLGVVKKVTDSLEEAGVDYVVWNGVLPDPTTASCDEAAEVARREKVDGIIAIGGGSAMDTGKAVDVLVGNPGKCEDWLQNNKTAPGVPQIFISTTAGTSCEMTPMGAISAPNGKKLVVWPCRKDPRLAVVDPELTVGMPPALTASTGMDSLTHAIESLTCTIPNPVSDQLAIDAIHMITKWLPLAVEDGSNMDAREGMHYAQLINGYSMANTCTHLSHAVAHALGKLYHVQHGIAAAFTLGENMERMAACEPERVRIVGEAMGADIPADATPEEIGRITKDAINAFKLKVKVPTVRSRLTLEQVVAGVPDYLAENVMFYCPIKPTVEEMTAFVTEAYQNEHE